MKLAGDTAVPSGCLLVAPGVSVGNVGQQAVDLLVATLGEAAVCLGPVTSKCLRSVAGAGVFTGTGSEVVTAATLYHVPSCELLILQQRALVHEGLEETFAVEVAAFQVETQGTGLLVLAGAQAFMRDDARLRGSPITPVVVTPEGIPAGRLLDGFLAALGDGVPTTTVPAGEEGLKAAAAPFGALFGGGLTVRHVRRTAAAGLPAGAVMVYVDEAVSNAGEARLAAAVVQGMFAPIPVPTAAGAGSGGAGRVEWVTPASWAAPEGPAPEASFYV